MLPQGFCLDLETTLAGRIPDSVRPPGEKRYETRIIEIGLAAWHNPSLTWGVLVNPLDTTRKIESSRDLFEYLISIHQNPTRTLNFWSKVLVNRNALSEHMFAAPQTPRQWFDRGIQHKANDFVRWHNDPSLGPPFVSEKQALLDLMRVTRKHNQSAWLAHNGKSFDFKVLKGASMRTGVVLDDDIQRVDTLRHFRKSLPGHKSYSQPILYKNIFKRAYNAHVAIDDAKALAELCHHVHLRTTPTKAVASPPTTPGASSPTKPDAGHLTPARRRQMRTTAIRKKMNLTFRPVVPKYPGEPLKRSTPKCPRTPLKRRVCPRGPVTQLRGVGTSTQGALRVLGIASVQAFVHAYQQHDEEWLRNILPAGVHWRRVAQSLGTAM